MSNRWIRIADKLPENEGMYIVAVENKELPNKVPTVTAAFFEDGDFVHVEQHSVYGGGFYVSHWDYLPSPPSDPY